MYVTVSDVALAVPVVTASVTYDTDGPASASVVINAGAAFATTLAAELTIAAVDAFSTGSNLQMQVSEDSGFVGVSWEPFATTRGWSL